jgi:hypothetical protein
LLSEGYIPQNEDVIIPLFQNKDSGLTITNIAESLFEKGEEYNKVFLIILANCILAKMWN